MYIYIYVYIYLYLYTYIKRRDVTIPVKCNGNSYCILNLQTIVSADAFRLLIFMDRLLLNLNFRESPAN